MRKASNLSKYLCACSLLFTASSGSANNDSASADTEGLDPALIQALQQATQDIKEQTTDLNSLVWLSSMSERLEKRIPNAFYRIRLLETVYSEAQIAGLDPQLVLAVIDIESNFDRFAHSHAGAQGLMQVMPFWKDVHGRPDDDLFNPLISLRYGCTILRHYMDTFETQTQALAAYNGSRGKVIYPNKVYRRLTSRWQFKTEQFTRNSFKEDSFPEVAAEKLLEQPLN